MKRLAAIILVIGSLILVWCGWTYEWGDPVTGWLAHRAQASLRREYNREVVAAPAIRPKRAPAEGRAAFLISIPRLGLKNTVVVQGTQLSDLDKGPGHYMITSMPGAGPHHVVAIAGHRTTWGAWFRHIDSIRGGDIVTLTTPYGAYRYRVMGHRIVPSGDWSILESRPWEKLVLSACHPLYSKSERFVIFAARVGDSA